MKIPLVGSSFKGLSVNVDSQRTLNWMEEEADSKDAKVSSAMVPTSGLAKLVDCGRNLSVIGSPVRALLELPIQPTHGASSLLMVCGNLVYRIDVDETVLAATDTVTYSAPVLVGTISNVATYLPATMAQNDQYVVITGENGFTYVYTIATGALSAAVVFDADAADFVPLVDVCFVAGYFLGYTNSGTGAYKYIFYSTINDPSTWSRADFFEAEADNSQLRKLTPKDGYLWVFKANSVQPFQATGDANNPFAPIQTGIIQRGCRTKGSVVQVGDYIYWLGSDKEGGGFVIYRTTGGGAERVSNAFVENLLQKMFDDFGPSGINQILAYGSNERGHSLYRLHCHPGKTTLVYDQLTSKWHERGWKNPVTGEIEEELGWVHSNFNGKHIVGDRRAGLDQGQIGAIYEMSEKFITNDVWPDADTTAHIAGVDTLIHRERTSPHFAGPNKEKLSCGDIELEFDTGSAQPNGTGSDPAVTLFISRDAGKTFGPGRVRTVGKSGEFRKKCIFGLNGEAYDFVFRIVTSDPLRLIAAYADLEKGY